MNPSVVQHIHRLISLYATVQYILILLQKLLQKNLPLINRRTARLMVPQSLVFSPSRSLEEPFTVFHFFNRFGLWLSTNINVLL